MPVLQENGRPARSSAIESENEEAAVPGTERRNRHLPVSADGLDLQRPDRRVELDVEVASDHHVRLVREVADQLVHLRAPEAQLLPGEMDLREDDAYARDLKDGRRVGRALQPLVEPRIVLILWLQCGNRQDIHAILPAVRNALLADDNGQ